MAGRGRPRSEHTTQAEAAKHIGLSITGFRNMMDGGGVPMPGPGVTLEDIRLAAFEHYRGRAARWTTDAKGTTKTRNLQDERARHASAQADKLEAELDLTRGDTVRVCEQLEIRGAQDVALRVRLNALGVRLCQQLAAESNPEAICEVLEAAVRSAMQGAVSDIPSEEEAAA